MYTPEAVVVISEYCLLNFKACRLGHPDFEIKFIDFSLLMSLKLHLFRRNICFHILHRSVPGAGGGHSDIFIPYVGSGHFLGSKF